MQKFLVLYLTPPWVLEEWAKTDPDTRKRAEEKMRGEWQAWMQSHERNLTNQGAGTGKTKRISREGVSDTKNDVMLYSIVEAESHEGAAKLFENHPHLQI